MKVEQTKPVPVFHPVTVTIQTENEYHLFLRMTNFVRSAVDLKATEGSELYDFATGINREFATKVHP